LSVIFKRLVHSADLQKEGIKGPTFHHLRHTFAVKRLVTWYREGKDVQALLPSLATYMGHVHYSDTAYYITCTPELMALVAERRYGPNSTKGDNNEESSKLQTR
jgi:integrase